MPRAQDLSHGKQVLCTEAPWLILEAPACTTLSPNPASSGMAAMHHHTQLPREAVNNLCLLGSRSLCGKYGCYPLPSLDHVGKRVSVQLQKEPRKEAHRKCERGRLTYAEGTATASLCLGSCCGTLREKSPTGTKRCLPLPVGERWMHSTH